MQPGHDAPSDLRIAIAQYSCPLINPPSQRGLFENKLHNIRLAIARMQPFTLAPGEAYSFWQRALAPTAENGYREGAMFINQQVTTSLGGGLCQLSGLIYNLALLAGLDILERHPHSIDAYGEDRYIPLGRDATVAYGRKDLRFGNPHACTVKLALEVDAQHAWGSVYAAQALDARIHIETRLLETLPSPLRRVRDTSVAPGQVITEPGLSGKRVSAWRVIERPGQAQRRETLSTDHYRATPTWLRRRDALLTPWMHKLLARLGLHG
jgi:vancomycin resistance protein YoaR